MFKKKKAGSANVSSVRQCQRHGQEVMWACRAMKHFYMISTHGGLSVLKTEL